MTARARAGHNTHGDGAGLDLIPAEPVDQAACDGSAGALARDCGRTSDCGSSGSGPACPLAPALQFIGYDGDPNHGPPRTCSGTRPAHLYISWVAACYGTSVPSQPCSWVAVFAARRDGETAGQNAKRCRGNSTSDGQDTADHQNHLAAQLAGAQDALDAAGVSLILRSSAPSTAGRAGTRSTAAPAMTS